MKKIISALELREGERIPFGYGLAYYDFAYMKATYYPIPLNIIIRAYRELYFLLMRGIWKSKHEKILYEIWNEGYKKGRQDYFHQYIWNKEYREN